jgi:anthranilate synthase/aminodeoxychorismate synthase-like glutamine amidotransferase
MKIEQMKLLIVDNNDSFTFNLAEMIRRIGYNDFGVKKSERIEVDEVEQYDKIIFTPGPGLPKDFPVMFEILKRYDKSKSIFGVCLGHQAIGEFYGAKLSNLNNVMHGISKPTLITDRNEIIFKDLPDKIKVGLYHSWFLSTKNFPSDLRITAVSDDGVIMALSHTSRNVKGVQFHPESIMTTFGKQILHNWLNG